MNYTNLYQWKSLWLYTAIVYMGEGGQGIHMSPGSVCLFAILLQYCAIHPLVELQTAANLANISRWLTSVCCHLSNLCLVQYCANTGHWPFHIRHGWPLLNICRVRKCFSGHKLPCGSNLYQEYSSPLSQNGQWDASGKKRQNKCIQTFKSQSENDRSIVQ